MKSIVLLLAPLLVFGQFYAEAQPPVVTEPAFPFDRQETTPSGSRVYATQPPADPGLYDSKETSITCMIPATEMEVKWLEPHDGVTSSTGLLIVLAGINYLNDCERPFYPPNENWADEKDVVIAQVFFRNLDFFSPYDYGKYQVSDILRGTAVMLDGFPQIDRRRLYLYGGSGGGLAGLQTFVASQHLWSEVYIHSAITKITTSEDSRTDYPEDPPPGVYGGWNVNLRFPESQGDLSDDEWERFQAERTLRAPQFNVRNSIEIDLGNPGNLPFVRVMHGTSDPTVDVQHFHALREALEQALGMPASSSTENQWGLQTWYFIGIEGGNHSYGGAAEYENTRAKATDYYFSNAFTRVKTEVPNLEVNWESQPVFGWRFRFSGSLIDATVEVVRAPIGTSWLFE